MKVLVVNCGSSSIKYQFYQMPEKRVISKGLVERIGEESGAIQHHYADEVRRLEGQIADHEEGMALILETLSGGEGVLGPEEEIDAIGHRVVHGGEEFTGSVLITPEVIASIERFSDLAPLHNPPEPHRHSRGDARAARRAPGGLLRHRVSRHDPAGRLHLRPALPVV